MSTFGEIAICAFPAEHAHVARSKGDSPLLLRTSSTDLKRPFLEAPSAGKTDEINTTLSHSISNCWAMVRIWYITRWSKPPHTHPHAHNKEATNSRAHWKIHIYIYIHLIWCLYSYCSYCGPANLIEIFRCGSAVGSASGWHNNHAFSAHMGHCDVFFCPWKQRKSSSWLRLASDKSRTWRTSSHVNFLSCCNCQQIIDRDARPLSLHMFLRTLTMSPGWLAPRFGVAQIRVRQVQLAYVTEGLSS